MIKNQPLVWLAIVLATNIAVILTAGEILIDPRNCLKANSRLWQTHLLKQQFTFKKQNHLYLILGISNNE
jgi:hypothetical protein